MPAAGLFFGARDGGNPGAKGGKGEKGAKARGDLAGGRLLRASVGGGVLLGAARAQGGERGPSLRAAARP